MQYIAVIREYDPKITGTNQPFSLEFKKNSFSNKDDENLFFKHLNDFEKVNIDSFEPFDPNWLKEEITLYPVGKRVKKLDFMSISPRLCGIWVAVSKKALKIIQKYKLPEYTIISINIDNYDEKYYLIGFPFIHIEYVDYSKSEFWDGKNKSTIKFSNMDEHRNYFFATATNIFLKKIYDYDILNTIGAIEICFSEKLANDLSNNGCTGLIFKSLDDISICTL